MKLQQNKYTKQHFISIPRSLLAIKKWKKGQLLDLRFNERGNIEIREIKN